MGQEPLSMRIVDHHGVIIRAVAVKHIQSRSWSQGISEKAPTMGQRPRLELQTVDSHHDRLVDRQRLVDSDLEIVRGITLRESLAMRKPGERRRRSCQRQYERERHRI